MKLPPGSKLASDAQHKRPVSAAAMAGVARLGGRLELAGPVVAVLVVVGLLALSFPRGGAWPLGGHSRAFDRPVAVSPLQASGSAQPNTSQPPASLAPSQTPLAPGSSTPAPPAAVATPATARTAPVPKPAPAASLQLVTGSAQLALVNADRGLSGLAPLTWSSCLTSVALANAQRLAASGVLSHANGPQADLGCGLGRSAGENIGYWSGGINDAEMNRMFMSSPEHRANLLNPAFHFVGIAWAVVPGGAGYIAEEFS